MPWAYADSRLALILRRLRGRFGICAPQVAIRTRVPWRLRVFGSVVVIAALLALAVWAFDFGRQIAGLSRGEIHSLQVSNAALEEELAKLRAQLVASENDLQIERAAQQSLAETNKTLLEENTRLKEELAVLEHLSKTRKR